MSDYTHSTNFCGVEGLFVGAAGSEVRVAGATGGLYQSGVALTGTAAEINRGRLKKVTGALAAVDTAGGIFAWQNPEASEILIELVRLVVTTKTTGACAVDVGTTVTNATTSSDNLIDGKDINAATGTFSNLDSAGTNGKAGQTLIAAKWVTCSVSGGGASAGLVGTYEIYYRVL